MIRKKAAILFSGGKDSCLALFKSRENYDIKYLLNVNVVNKDSFMFHKPDLNLLRKQAEMLEIKLIIKKSKGEENEELADLKELIKEVGKEVDVIVVGGIASSYQGNRVKKICEELDLEFYAPLWDYKSEKIWKELLDNNFKVIITKIACEGLGKEWLEKEINKENFKILEELSKKYKFRLDFEGGEAETAVLDMPGFKKDIKIKFDIDSEGEHRHSIRIREIK